MIHFIVNPSAGGGKAQKSVLMIQNFMNKKHIKYKISFTKCPNDATQIARQAVLDGDKKIIAVGGDGTALEVLCGLKPEDDVYFGVIPLGTGNDFVRTLNIGKDIETALNIVISDNYINSDFIEVLDKYCLNISSIGIDAEIVKDSYALKKAFKGFSYLAAVLKNVVDFKPYRATLVIDGKIIDDDFTLVAIANGKYYGGGFMIAPSARLDSGEMLVCTCKKMSNAKMMRVFPMLYAGTHGKLDEVKFYTAKDKVELYLDKKMNLNVDGNIFPNQEKMEFKIRKNAIKILSP